MRTNFCNRKKYENIPFFNTYTRQKKVFNVQLFWNKCWNVVYSLNQYDKRQWFIFTTPKRHTSLNFCIFKNAHLSRTWRIGCIFGQKKVLILWIKLMLKTWQKYRCFHNRKSGLCIWVMKISLVYYFY